MRSDWQKKTKEWQPDQQHRVIETIDTHTEGEPLRIVTSGLPTIPGETILEKRSWAMEHLEGVRKRLMFEPRGHADMYGCFVTEPEREDSDFGALFIHNEGYSSMCGHAILALTKVAAQFDWVERSHDKTTLKIDTPAGQVSSWANWENDRIESVAFENVPSFLVSENQKLKTDSLGTIHYDLAFGGAYYAYVDLETSKPFGDGHPIEPDNVSRLIEAGREIKQRVAEQEKLEHPFSKELSFLYGTIFISRAVDPSNHSRNVCIFAEGEVDRSPTGTGVSGRAAIHFARNEIAVGQNIRIESILGTRFEVRVKNSCHFGPYSAIVPIVSGNAFITGRHQFLLDPEDPIESGFIFR